MKKLGDLNLFNIEESRHMEEKRKQNFISASKALNIVISATFTAEPVRDYIKWWCNQFNENVSIQFAPYNQVYQELLNSSGMMSQNNGINFLLVRFEDWIRDDNSPENEICNKLQICFEELVDILSGREKAIPYFVGIFPVSTHLSLNEKIINFIQGINKRFIDAISHIENVYQLDFTYLSRNYCIRDIFDPIKDREGHMPFSEEFYAAMGTEMARKIHCWRGNHFKVVAVDCDNTLWKGLCGEDGINGILVDEPYAELQKSLIKLYNEGVLLVLCSKNNENDILEVFEKVPGMLLKKEHFIGWRVNWKPKSENIRELAYELNLGLENFIFIDDSFHECLDMMTHCPEVLTLQLPDDPEQIPAYINHIWAFDRLKVTEEDRTRSEMYKIQQARHRAQEASLNYQDFLRGMKLKVSMNLVQDSQIFRVAQLIQRTNQFNLSTIRRTEEEIKSVIALPDVKCWVIQASDRFGDYGIVGVIITIKDYGKVVIDTFLLSCRTLGRYVEDAALSGLKKYCIESGINFIDAKFIPTSKNAPFLEFVRRMPWKIIEKSSLSTNYGIDAEEIPDAPYFIDFYYKSHFKDVKSKDECEIYMHSSNSTEIVICVNPVNNAKECHEKMHYNNWSVNTVNEENLLNKSYLLPIRNHTASMLLKLSVSVMTERSLLLAGYSAPQNDIEEKVSSIWGELLRINRVGINDDFFNLGGNSLSAVNLISRIYRDFGVNIPLKEVFKNPTVKEMASYISKAERSIHYSIQPAGNKSFYEASSSQKRLYILAKLEGVQTAYNMSQAMIIQGRPDKERLEQAFTKLILRHEALRTSFKMVDDKIVQHIHENPEFYLEYIEIDEEYKGNIENKAREVVSSFIRPFNLEKAPMFRAALVKLSAEKYILLYDMHHIISDGISMNILMKEFVSLYNGERLPEIRMQYKDFSEWQNELFRSNSIKRQEKFWIDMFSGEIPVLNMPMDYPRPSVQTFEGDTVKFELSKDLAKELKMLALKVGTTLYMVVLALYNLLLFKYTEQEDIIIGSPIAGRKHADLQDIIGVFINTIAMRNYPKANKTFIEFLLEVKENCLKAYENQDYQFENLVSVLDLKRDFNRNPLFDTMFIMQKAEDRMSTLDGLTIMPYEYGNRVSKVDLTLNAIETSENIIFEIEYCTKLFKKETIQTLAAHFVNLLTEATNNPYLQLAKLDMLSENEKKRILYNFNDTYMEYPRDKTVDEFFEEQVYAFPQSTALIFQNKMLSYHELNERSNRLARELRSRGIKPDDVVGIMVSRSFEMIIAMLGVLKAGGAYLPLDPNYPRDRIEYMLKDSQASILITQTDLRRKIEMDIEILCLNDKSLFNGDVSNLHRVHHPENLAYVIYTSGSTGNPKGVMIEHRAVANFISGVAVNIECSRDNVIVALTTMSFDIFVLETLLPLSKGMKVVIADKNEQMDAKALNDLILRHNVDMLQVTPSRLMLLTGRENCLSCFNRLKTIMVGGEALPESLLKTLKHLYSNKIYNMYGPTETTVWSTIKNLTYSEKVNIGRPIANTRIYIVGKGDSLQPVKAVGELCIAGEGLSRGYINKPEITEERFVSDPFKKGSRMYRTGDLARWLPNGEIEYIGRTDFQLKIRGYRIEMEEIEKLLLMHRLIKKAAVVSREEKSGDENLYAFIVSDRELTASEIRHYLGEKLPDYMIPSYFVRLDKLPITQNGKLDRKALLEIDVDVVCKGAEYVCPVNDIQKDLVLLWEELLRRENISINDNFFEVGGNSMLLIQMHDKIDKKYPGKITVTDLFAVPTIKKLAEYMEERGDKSNSGLSLKTITLDKEYFTDEYKDNLSFSLNTRIQGDLYEKLKQVSSIEDVSIADILLGLYINLLGIIGETYKVDIQAYINGKDIFYTLNVDLESIGDYSDLLKTIKHRKLSAGIPGCSLEKAGDTGIVKQQGSIIPLFYEKLEQTSNIINLLDVFDIVITACHDRDSMLITYEYDVGLLRAEKMEYIYDNYIKMIYLLVEEYKFDEGI